MVFELHRIRTADAMGDFRNSGGKIPWIPSGQWESPTFILLVNPSDEGKDLSHEGKRSRL
jgi:hypothetical protein